MLRTRARSSPSSSSSELTIANLLPTAAGVVAAARVGVEGLARQVEETCTTAASRSAADRM